MQGLHTKSRTLHPSMPARPGRPRQLTEALDRRALPSASAIALGVSLALAAWPAEAIVVTSGDASPTIASSPNVDLTGQRIFLGFTTGGVGTLGTLTVNGGSFLTAAQIVTGIDGLGTGIVTVTGAGSTINLTGGGAFNGLDVGSWGTGTMTVSNGGRVICSSPLACPFSDIGNAAGSTGTLNIDGGSVSGLGTLTVGRGALQQGFGTAGANTTGTLSITNGGTLSTTGSNSVANNDGQTGLVTGNVTISGAGSSWNITRDLANGGNQAGLTLGRVANTSANVTISNGGNLTITGARANPAGDNSIPFLNLGSVAGASGTMTVSTGGSVVLGGDSGVINVGGSQGGVGGNATLNINSGGRVSGTGTNGLVFMSIGRNQSTGTVNVSGAGSQLVVAGVGGTNTGLDGNGGQIIVGRNQGNGGGTGTLNVTNGGSIVISDNAQAATTGVGLTVANGTGSSGTVAVSGLNSTITVSSTGSGTAVPFVTIGNGGTAQMTISNGGSVAVQGAGQRNFIVGNSTSGSGTLNVTTGGQLNASWFAIGNNGGSGVATVNNSTVVVNGTAFSEGAPFGGSIRVGRGEGAVGVLNLENAAIVNVNNTVASASVILGGTSTLSGGTGTLNMSGGSQINFTGSAASAGIQVGGTGGIGFMTMTGSSTVNVGATGGVVVGNSADSSGFLTVGGGSKITANNIGIGGNGDAVAGGVGVASVSGAGSELRAIGDNGFMSVGRSGIGTLAVSNQGTLTGTILNVGRSAGGFGTLTVDNGTINLSGQQAAGNGAGMAVGNRGGTGVATINNSQVSITNLGSGGAGLNVGGTPTNPLGTGTLTVSNSQVNLVAAPGLATVRIGHDGTGTATLNTTTLNVGDGSLIIAGQPGSSGTLTLNAGTVVNTGYVGVGATQSGPGGAGNLVMNNSTINTTTFEIGALGVLSGNGAVINATGDVIVGGIISPGNSPGRININCNLITLPGSRLILDIQSFADGYDVDHLIIGNDSTFSLSSLQIVFNFLGNTDPTAFAASGGFDLDNFIQSLNPLTGAVTGLSTVFGPEQSWATVVDASRITVQSSDFDVSQLALRADGAVDLVAAPIPEPSTWLMMALGLFSVTAVARRRSQSQGRRAVWVPTA
jgi:T5SS/PEP-CTERM-associated repeat protein